MCVFFIPKLGHDDKNGLINEVEKRRKTVTGSFFFFSNYSVLGFFFFFFSI